MTHESDLPFREQINSALETESQSFANATESPSKILGEG
jgi:hypothetical protein